jgi:hypothetical protein
LNRKIIIILSLLICTITLFSASCSDSQLPPASNTADDSPINIESPEQDIPIVPEQTQQSESSAVVEVVYFHTSQRCVTCLCFEERVTSVIEHDFDNEIKSGKLVYKIINVMDEDNAQIVAKYNAYGSQLFINKIVDNKDNIDDIIEIWDWQCTKDKPGFDARIKDLIEQNLEEIAD